MDQGIILGQWIALCDAAERAGDNLRQALDGDPIQADYCARQLGKAARAALLVIYHLETGINDDEAKSLATALVKLTTGRYQVRIPPESTGERRMR